MLDKSTFDAVISVLTPLMTMETTRLAFVTQAFYDAPILIQQTEFDGDAYEFTVNLVLESDQFGQISPGKLAVVALLEHARTQVGQDVQEKIDRIIADILRIHTEVPAAFEGNAPDDGAHIFISYSRANLPFVQRLTRDLQTRNVNIWIDKIGLKPGTPDWENALREAIAAADGVILIASPDSRQSPYVRDEIAIARAANRTLYPVWAEGDVWTDCIPMGLGYIQFVDMRDDQYKHGLKELVSTLTEGTNQELYHSTNIAPTFQRPALSKIILATMIILASIFGIWWSIASLNRTGTNTTIGQGAAANTATLSEYDVGIVFTYFATTNDVDPDTLTEIDQWAATLAHQIEHDLGHSEYVNLHFGVLGPDHPQVGRIEGANNRERQRSAQELAEQLEADVVVYGQVVLTGNNVIEITPEYYLSFRENELINPVLGRFTNQTNTILISGDINDQRNQLKLNTALSNQVKAMAQMLAGIAYYNAEFYSDANLIFEELNNNDAWRAIIGDELSSILLGHAQLGIAVRALNERDINAGFDAVLSSEQYFQRVLGTTTQDGINPESAQAYTGLASSNFITWHLIGISTNQPQIAPLEQALANLQSAMLASDQPVNTSIQSRIHLSRLMVIHTLLRYHSDEISPETLEQYRSIFNNDLELLISRYESNPDTILRGFVSEAYGIAGINAMDDKAWETSLDYLSQATELSLSPARIMVYQAAKALVYKNSGDLPNALASYEEANRLALALGDNEAVREYQSEIDQLQSNDLE